MFSCWSYMLESAAELYFILYCIASCSHTPKHSHMQQIVQQCISLLWSFLLAYTRLFSYKSSTELAKSVKCFTKKLDIFRILLMFTSVSYVTWFLFCHIDSCLWAGSCNPRGYYILDKVTKEEVFGFRMSKSSPCWWFKWKFICLYW